MTTAAQLADTVREQYERNCPVCFEQCGDCPDVLFPVALAALVELAEEAERALSGRTVSCSRCNETEARAEEAERERDEYRAANESVAVCAAHTTEVTRGDCLVCAVEEANSRAAKLEAALREIVEAADVKHYSYHATIEIARAALLVSAGRDEQETT